MEFLFVAASSIIKHDASKPVAGAREMLIQSIVCYSFVHKIQVIVQQQKTCKENLTGSFAVFSICTALASSAA
ncbi:hypothetical protein [Planococcus salinus]|uniref:hypothetical protein n=1 Tax=Planococcus salinus TaxID=1848460 RepID=UPI0019622348|nr:hypothetical protein [Planococcus salinus]